MVDIIEGKEGMQGDPELTPEQSRVAARALIADIRVATCEWNVEKKTGSNGRVIETRSSPIGGGFGNVQRVEVCIGTSPDGSETMTVMDNTITGWPNEHPGSLSTMLHVGDCRDKSWVTYIDSERKPKEENFKARACYFGTQKGAEVAKDFVWKLPQIGT